MSNYEKCLSRINNATEIKSKMYVGYVILDNPYELHVNRKGTVVFRGESVPLNPEEGTKLYDAVLNRIDYLTNNMREAILNKL